MQGTALASLIALVLPLIVAFVATSKTSSAVKGSLAALFSVAVGAIVVFLGHDPVVERYAITIVAVIVAAQASYGMLWKPLGVTSWILDHLGRTAPSA
jgi:uncharacterized membrane protein